MNQLYLSSLILLVVAIGLTVYAAINANLIILALALLVFLLAIWRYIIIRQSSKMEINYQQIQDDLIAKKLNSDQGKYAMMYNIYKSSYTELLYGENDGVLLYDSKHDLYLAKVESSNAANDMLSRMKYPSETLLLFDEASIKDFEPDFHLDNQDVYYVNNKSLKFSLPDIEQLQMIKNKNTGLYDDIRGITFENEYQRQVVFAEKNNELIKNKKFSYTEDAYIGEVLSLEKYYYYRLKTKRRA